MTHCWWMPALNCRVSGVWSFPQSPVAEIRVAGSRQKAQADNRAEPTANVGQSGDQPTSFEHPRDAAVATWSETRGTGEESAEPPPASTMRVPLLEAVEVQRRRRAQIPEASERRKGVTNLQSNETSAVAPMKNMSKRCPYLIRGSEQAAGDSLFLLSPDPAEDDSFVLLVEHHGSFWSIFCRKLD